MTSVHVATPAFGGQVTVPYLRSIVGLAQALSCEGIPNSFEWLSSESFIPRGRDYLATSFLSNSTHDVLLMLDADIGFEASDILRLLGELGDEIVCCAYPKKRDGGGMVTTGAGCVLIPRMALNEMKEVSEQYNPNMDGCPLATLWGFFLPLLEDDEPPHGPFRKLLLCDDHAFLKRAQLAGVTVRADSSARLSHTGPQTWEPPG